LSVEKPNSAAALKTRNLVYRALRPLVLLLLIGALVSTGCGQEIPPHILVTLTTGDNLRLRELRPSRSADGQKGVYLKYQTEISSEDLEALRAEIQQIWVWFLRPQVERAQLKNALIVATTQHQDGWEPSGYEFKMTYHKTALGKWLRN